ncbi:MAG: cytochrome c class [Acidobacteria bacterium]|nr:cytochrome c class [Acidobacteriota bacterium]
MKRALVLLCAALLLLAAAKKAPRFNASLPTVGTRFGTLPLGKGRAQTEAACYACHSADLLLQQRLTEKQWTAAVEKMIRWGAEVKDADKPVVIAYLAKNFGPENKFVPRKTRPIGY